MGKRVQFGVTFGYTAIAGTTTGVPLGKAPRGWTRAGDWHTHGDYSKVSFGSNPNTGEVGTFTEQTTADDPDAVNDENFSNDDVNAPDGIIASINAYDATAKSELGVSYGSYLGTPVGKFVGYDRDIETGRVLGEAP